MAKNFKIFAIIAILTLILTGCQVAVQSASAQSISGAPSGTLPANFAPDKNAATPTAAATATATARPTATASATAVPVTAAAESAAKAYAAALQKKDFSAASHLVSIYSLSFINLTRSQAAAALSTAGATWSNFSVVGSQVFSSATILVHVTYQTGTTATATATSQVSTPAAAASQVKDELWPFRLENGAWLYGWNNLIDYKVVDVAAQTNEHITVKPTQLVRYSDRIELHFMMQNQTSDVVYFVQTYDSLAVFHFGDQSVEADKSKQIAISGLRTSFDETIVVKGLYTSYPNSVEIKKWKGYAPNPWYTFEF